MAQESYPHIELACFDHTDLPADPTARMVVVGPTVDYQSPDRPYDAWAAAVKNAFAEQWKAGHSGKPLVVNGRAPASVYALVGALVGAGRPVHFGPLVMRSPCSLSSDAMRVAKFADEGDTRTSVLFLGTDSRSKAVLTDGTALRALRQASEWGEGAVYFTVSMPDGTIINPDNFNHIVGGLMKCLDQVDSETPPAAAEGRRQLAVCSSLPSALCAALGNRLRTFYNCEVRFVELVGGSYRRAGSLN